MANNADKYPVRNGLIYGEGQYSIYYMSLTRVAKELAVTEQAIVASMDTLQLSYYIRGDARFISAMNINKIGKRLEKIGADVGYRARITYAKSFIANESLKHRVKVSFSDTLEHVNMIEDFREWKPPTHLAVIKFLKDRGVTHEQAANIIGISSRSFEGYTIHPEKTHSRAFKFIAWHWLMTNVNSIYR